MNNNQYNNTNIVTPNNFYGATGQPPESKTRKTIFIIAIVVAVCVILTTIVLIAILNRNNTGDTPSFTSRENTSTLQLYAALKDEMTLGELQQAVNDFDVEAEITIMDGGFGTIKIPDAPDSIFFYIDRADDSYVETGAIDTLNSSTETANIISTYQPNDITYDYRYAYELYYDTNIGIGRDEEDGTYEVYTETDDFAFPTKQEAIEAYLAPEIQQ